ncbi:MAG TPA: glycoside hydrolase [Synergistaceae bacterium]|nr:glycoside hydrolase [Synergistaceae bacterium]
MPPMICLHGHFYQPARENPWIGRIELQPSAAPYHDWNHRVAAESYGPNAAARILGADGRIRSIVNNYARMSFNFGPTLLSWMEKERSDLYRAVLDADRRTAERFSGHGGAMANIHSHMIMPLASRRDKVTQVLWGIGDFTRRFNRAPEGMWLPEAAVDSETLDIMAENGILFTVLAPRQAQAVRPMGENGWKPVPDERVDTTRPYRCALPSGRSIAIFFYDNLLSHDVAFGDLLKDGAALTGRLLSASARSGGGLVSLAVDGETFGHHHKYGDMALAWCLEAMERRQDIRLTVYGEYLEKNPPRDEVRIVENSSWSCSHGVERWRSDCGCAPQDYPTWSQRWRAPLRKAYDGLREQLDPLFEREAGALLAQPWGARDRYIGVVLDRTPQVQRDFLAREALRPLSPEEECRTLSLLEMERNLMLLYTSCGWFFDDLSRIETIQTMAYAGRAIDLAEDLFGSGDILEPFLAALAEAKSNRPEYGDGERIFRHFVEPLKADLRRGAAIAAMLSLLLSEDDAPVDRGGVFPSWRILRYSTHVRDEGARRLLAGVLRIQSADTLEERDFIVAALHETGGELVCRVADHPGGEGDEAEAMIEAVLRAGDADELQGVTYSFADLFGAEQRAVLEDLLHRGLERAAPLLARPVLDYVRFRPSLHPSRDWAPPSLPSVAEIVLNRSILDAIARVPFDGETADRLVEEALRLGVRLDGELVRQALARRLGDLFGEQEERGPDGRGASEILALLTIQGRRGWNADLWPWQNAFARIVASARGDGRPPLPEEYGAIGTLLGVSLTVTLPDGL